MLAAVDTGSFALVLVLRRFLELRAADAAIVPATELGVQRGALIGRSTLRVPPSFRSTAFDWLAPDKAEQVQPHERCPCRLVSPARERCGREIS